MEPLFTTQTDLILEEYQKFNAAVMSKNYENSKLKKHLKWIWILVAVAILEIVVFHLLPGNSGAYDTFSVILITVTAIIIILSLVAYLFIRCPFFLNKSVEKAYFSNSFLQNNRLQSFSFYADHFEEKTNASLSKIEYSLIHTIIETETNFYILTGENQGYVIIKNNCSPELIEFIQNLKPQGSK